MLSFIFFMQFALQYVILGSLFNLIYFKTKCYYEDDGKQNRRLKGGVVVIANHRSFLDGLSITFRFFFKRWHFISEDFFKERYKIVKFIVRSVGGIFIDSDINSFDFIEECKRKIAKGRPILIYPEGGFQHTYEPSKFYTGYILLAVNTGAKIVPIVNDFNFGLFKRTHLLIGNSIDLSEYSNTELTWAKRKEINKKIYDKYMMLFYQLKKKKAEKFSFKYESVSPKPGDVIRIPAGHDYHYGVYLNDNEVIQFGNAKNNADGDSVANSVSLSEFCGDARFEVRIAKKRFTRTINDIEKYARSCLGQGRYDTEKNNCLDFANRVTLKI